MHQPMIDRTTTPPKKLSHWEIWYTDVIELGFKRQNIKDKIFEKQHGYEYFICCMNIGRYNLDFNPLTQEVKLYHNHWLIPDVKPITELAKLKEIITILRAEK